jgi:hypothetical protein
VSDELLILGPVLRRVTGRAATVWVQTVRPGTVRVTAGSATATAATFTVHGLHFALVVVASPAPGTPVAYRVDVDGTPAWPPADYAYPAPVIRAPAVDGDVRVVFGSCRESSPYAGSTSEADALDAYATRLAGSGMREPPDLLLLVGDQVYADVTSKSTRAWLRKRRPFRRRDAPPKQVVDFAEYARLYRESWSDPDVRWLLSTVPTITIFDDHEIIDDWNTSASWRRDMRKLSWWPERISAGLASYWVFQHAGNLDPEALADDPGYRAIRSAAGGDAATPLAAFATAADAAVDGGDAARPYRWSFCLDIGRTRVVVLDNRCARVLTPGARAMVTTGEWRWFAGLVAGDYEHLLVATSLPWLMPYAIHDLEAASERWADSRFRPLAALGERLRRVFDLEHWPAFGASFDDLAALLATAGAADPDGDAAVPVMLAATVAAGDRAAEVVGERAEAVLARRRPPASISVLSGDVHHSYVARAAYGPRVATPVHQITCSPFHNRVPRAIKPLMRAAWHRRGKRIGRVLARRAGATRPLVSWLRLAGPYFGNAIATVRHSGPDATVTLEGTDERGGLARLTEVRLSLTPRSG